MENTINIYPNPASDYIAIKTEYNSEVYIFSMTGQLMFKEENYMSENQIDISTLANGSYLITIINNFKTEIKKLFVNR